jgi:hypothetical protein
MAVITIPRVLRERLGEDGAEAFADILKEFEVDSHKNLATKDDIARLELATKEDITALKEATKEDIFMLKADIARLEGEIKTIKWMLGVVVAGVASLIFKSFFM